MVYLQITELLDGTMSCNLGVNQSPASFHYFTGRCLSYSRGSCGGFYEDPRPVYCRCPQSRAKPPAEWIQESVVLSSASWFISRSRLWKQRRTPLSMGLGSMSFTFLGGQSRGKIRDVSHLLFRNSHWMFFSLKVTGQNQGVEVCFSPHKIFFLIWPNFMLRHKSANWQVLF